MNLVHVATSPDPNHVTACPFVMPETPVPVNGVGRDGAVAYGPAPGGRSTAEGAGSDGGVGSDGGAGSREGAAAAVAGASPDPSQVLQERGEGTRVDGATPGGERL